MYVYEQPISSPERTRLRRCAVSLLFVACLALGGCGTGEPSYYPLAEGRWWYYDVREVVLDEPRERRFLLFNAGRIEAAGGRAWLQTAQQASADVVTPRGEGVERIAHRRAGGPLIEDAPPRVILPETRAAGAEWTVTSTLGLVESRTFAPADRIIVRRVPITLNKTIAAVGETVTVSAGRFENCLRVDGVSHAFVGTDRGNSEAAVTVTTREWYAPGVGLVRLERTESSESTFLKTGTQTWTLADFGE